MMKFYFGLAAALTLSASLSAQKISLKWDAPKTQDFGIEIRLLPHFSNGDAVYDAAGISLYMGVSAPSHDLEITNLVWREVPGNELYDISVQNIPEKDNFGISYNGETASVRISAFKKASGKIYRLESFDLINKPDTKRGNSFSKKIGTTENPLKSGTFYKIKVDKSGIFKITSKFLKDNGINPNNINPKNFRIYGNGGLMLPEYNADERYSALQENAIEIKGEEDGVWNDGDYALFYAQGPNGYHLYGNGNRTETRTDPSENFQNIYEDYAYYFINFDTGPHKKVEAQDGALPQDIMTEFDDYQVINEEKNNLLELGRNWVGDAFTKTKTVDFKTVSPLPSGSNVKFRTRVIGYKAQGTELKINLNGTLYSNTTIGPKAESFIPVLAAQTIPAPSGNQISFSYEPNIAGNPNAAYYLDYAEISYKQPLKYNDGQMNFRSFDDNDEGTDYAFSVANAAGIEEIWDVSDVTNATRKINKTPGNSFTFPYRVSDSFFRNEFVAFKNSAAYTPQFVGKVDRQNLSEEQGVDYLIISNKNLLDQAKRIETYYKDKFRKVLTVTDEQIYNEYSSGSKDITAIRDFVTKLYGTGLKYVLLVGDTSYDFKNKSGKTGSTIPSYESEYSGDFVNSYVTDDYFVMAKTQTDKDIENILPDLPIGRLPAQNLAEAKLLVDKTLAYYNALPKQSSPFGIWRMKLDFIADDDGDGGTMFHQIVNDDISANFEGKKKDEQGNYVSVPIDKPEYNIRKLYLDAFPAEISAGGQRYPQINRAITSDLGNSLYMSYFGHGGVNGWAQERVLTSDDISTFRNFSSVYSRFPLVSTITCEFTLWDNHNIYSAGEQFLKHAEGGAAEMITSSRALGVDYGEKFSGFLTSELFRKNSDDDFNTIGNAHLLAKKGFGTTTFINPITGIEETIVKSNPNHLKVNFLGDPAMKLSRPKNLLEIDEVISKNPDHLQALDKVTIKGHINKADKSLDKTFNGKVAINIFDKRLSKKTLNNDGGYPVMQYTEEAGPIVKASGTAKDGTFTVEFYMPKDINYTVDFGRILAYADNNVYDVYQNKPYKIGGIGDAITDNTPPKVNLYMNNTNFADGGITNESPVLLACLTDDTGINSTGAGVGHDITVILDGEVINTIVLNDFFSAGQSNGCATGNLAEYQKGTVNYPFSNLKPGNHQITFKVWDINNNSTTSTLNFTVKGEGENNLTLKRPMNWPNPFTDKTYIHFEHNCDDVLDVNVQIYTITGKLVKTISQSITSDPFMQGTMEGYRTPKTAIGWDGKDDFGDAVGKGTYIFKIFAKSQNQDKCRGTATAVEKMVLLR